MPISVLVVEDEFAIALDIEMRLKKMGFDVTGIAENDDTAIKMAEEEAPQLILMDIHLEGSKNGIEIAKQVHDELHIPVVFLTAHADSATFQQALKANPYGYVLKPFKDVDLKNTIELAYSKYKDDLDKRKKVEFAQNILATALEKENNNSFFVKEKNIVHKIDLQDIFWIEALDNYTNIHTSSKRYTIHSYLRDVLISLPEEKFLRTHRSFAVAKDKISIIKEDKIVLLNQTEVALSRSYKNVIIEQIKIL